MKLEDLKPGLKIVSVITRKGVSMKGYTGTVTKITKNHIHIDMDIFNPDGSLNKVFPIKWTILQPGLFRRTAEIGHEAWQPKNASKYQTTVLVSAEEFNKQEK